MIQIPPGFDFQLLFSDFLKFGLALVSVVSLGVGFTLVCKGSKRSVR